MRPQRAFEGTPPSQLSVPAKHKSRSREIHEVLEMVPGDHTAPNSQKEFSIQRMKNRHHVVLTLLLEGNSYKQIAGVTGYTEARVSQIVRSPIFQSLYKAILAKRYEAVIEGDHGVVAQARAASPQLTRSLIGIANAARNENTRRQAILDVLALAGHQPVTKTETLSLDKLVEQFNDAEMEVFARTGKWPRRFAAQMRSLGREVDVADVDEFGEAVEPEFSVVDAD